VRIFVCIALLAVVCSVFCPSVRASDFPGLTISWQYYAWGGACNGRESNGTFLDNGGIGGTFIDAQSG